MKRSQLEHVILEIGRRNDLEYFFIVGSAAILAFLPDPPEGALTATRDVDVIPPEDDDALADRLSWVLGEGSEFEIEHGYYVQGVSWSTPQFAPRDWHLRACPIHVDNRYTGLCMEPHDLVLSKLGAGREKDIDFSLAVADLGLIEVKTLRQRLEQINATDTQRELIGQRITGLFASNRSRRP